MFMKEFVPSHGTRVGCGYQGGTSTRSSAAAIDGGRIQEGSLPIYLDPQSTPNKVLYTPKKGYVGYHVGYFGPPGGHVVYTQQAAM